MLLNLNTEYSTLTNQVNGGFLCYEALILILLYNLKDKLEFSIHSLFIPLLSISTLPNIYFQIPGKPILVIHCWLPSVCLIPSFIQKILIAYQLCTRRIPILWENSSKQQHGDPRPCGVYILNLSPISKTRIHSFSTLVQLMHLRNVNGHSII